MKAVETSEVYSLPRKTMSACRSSGLARTAYAAKFEGLREHATGAIRLATGRSRAEQADGAVEALRSFLTWGSGSITARYVAYAGKCTDQSSRAAIVLELEASITMQQSHRERSKLSFPIAEMK